MHNRRIRHASTFWRDGVPWEPWEAELMDAQQAANLNGDDGETFDSETMIVIGGAGMVIEAPFRAHQLQRCKLATTTAIEFPSRTKTRFQHLERGATPDSDDWTMTAANGWAPHWRQTIADVNYVWIPLLLPVGSTLTEIRATFRGAPAHTVLPASPPQLSYCWADFDDVTPVVVATAADAPTVIADYQDDHHLVRSVATANVIQADRRYFARFRGESGSDSEVGLRLQAIRTTVTVTEIDEWVS